MTRSDDAEMDKRRDVQRLVLGNPLCRPREEEGLSSSGAAKENEAGRGVIRTGGEGAN